MSKEEDNDSNEPIRSSWAVVIDPVFEEDEYTGRVTMSLEEDFHDDMSDSHADGLRYITGVLGACLPLMQIDPEFASYVHDFYMENYTEDDIEFVEDDNPPVTTTSEGNVIKLNFNTKTYGGEQ